MPPKIETSIVFLHIPKTAGQSIHTALSNFIGEKMVSPIRVHTQVGAYEAQFPAGYSLYSGHLDWVALNSVRKPRFVFTVLRDPLERLASFYYYLREKSLNMSLTELEKPENLGLRTIGTRSIADYFFGGRSDWQKFILDHYYNPYCAYFISKKIRGYEEIKHLTTAELVHNAWMESSKLDAIYNVNRLEKLDHDMHLLFGAKISVKNTRVNIGPGATSGSRWKALKEELDNDELAQMLYNLVAADIKLMDALFPKNDSSE